MKSERKEERKKGKNHLFALLTIGISVSWIIADLTFDIIGILEIGRRGGRREKIGDEIVDSEAFHSIFGNLKGGAA